MATDTTTADFNKSLDRLVQLSSGYDLPLYGLKDGSFYSIHATALACIATSFVCANTSILLAFRQWGDCKFFLQWTKSQRFVVYMAICDLLFNLFHFMDHCHIIISKSMVQPKELCVFYGFMVIVFIAAQNLMVNVAAVNACMLLYFDKNVSFGSKDWKLLLWIFGFPFVVGTIAAATGQLGPNGAYCHVDSVKGKVVQIILGTIIIMAVFIINSVLYVLTWAKMYKQGRNFRTIAGVMPSSMQASHKATRSMTLFVLAFIIQWSATCVYSIWITIDPRVPRTLIQAVTVSGNLGGLLNLFVFLIIKRQGRTSISQNTTRPMSEMGFEVKF